MRGTRVHEGHVRAAGGVIVVTHNAIGVVFAHSKDSKFAANVLRLDSNLRSVGIPRPFKSTLAGLQVVACHL